MKRQLITLMTALLFGWSLTASATTLKLAPGSKLWLEGNSTLHPYAVKATITNVDFSYDSTRPLDAALAAHPPVKLVVRIRVSGLKSEHSWLDKNLRKALKADKNPDIVFTLASYRVTEEGAIVASGSLKVAGVEKPETINGTLKAQNSREVIDGQEPLLMTDFGVKPPTWMLGALKTDDRIVVKFHLVLEPSRKQASRDVGE